MKTPDGEAGASNLFHFERLRLVKPPDQTAEVAEDGNADVKPAVSAIEDLVELAHEMR